MSENKFFKDLKIFESEEINNLCDHIFNLVASITGSQPILCGSVAKMLSGVLDEESYKAKDIDFYLPNSDFRKLKQNLPSEVTGVKMIEVRPERIIFHGLLCIEIWCNLEKEENETFGILLKKNKIPYKNYGNKI